MSKAVFLDRDGVINKMIFTNERKEYEPPYRKEDLKLYDGVIESLKKLQDSGFKLFLISNQPDYAKGKASLENLAEVQDELQKIFIKNEIRFSEYYYCYHHPDGTVPEYSIECECRKPGNYFVLKAFSEYNISNESSWFIGDRDKDVECGIKSGLRTIRIESGYYEYKSKRDADYVVSDLNEAVETILLNSKK